MAKLTLSFRNRKLKVISVREQRILIGRDPECTISIDSLAIEPQHASIRNQDGTFVLEPVSKDTPVLVNDDPVSDFVQLNEADRIGIGKHSLTFSFENEGTPADENVARLPVTGWLQIQSGAHLGRTIRLDKAFTRIGKPEGELAIITRRDNGYHVAYLQGDRNIEVDGQSIGEQTRPLSNGCQIQVGELLVQFFTDACAARGAEPDDAGEEYRQQRRFNRIPFDVTARLQSAEHLWEGQLVDISLHGALIRTDETVHTNDGQLLLTVQLEGGPSIYMDVEIAHREGNETGLRCKDIDVDSITHLRRLLELNLGDSELLQRELSALG
jgi:hypothetical protein